MSEMDFFGYWATFFLLVGTWLSIEKDHKGWAFRMFGSLIWAYIGLRIHMVSLWVCELVFAALAIKGYLDWREPTGNEWTDEELPEPTEFTGFPFTYDKPMWVEGQPLTGIPLVTSAWIPNSFTPLEIKEPKKRGKNKTKQRQSKGKAMAAKRGSIRKSKVQPATRRRSKQTHGQSRSRSDVKSRGTKKSRRNV